MVKIKDYIVVVVVVYRTYFIFIFAVLLFLHIASCGGSWLFHFVDIFFIEKKRDKLYCCSFKTFSGKKISAKSDENNCGWRKFVYNFRVTISRITYPSENVYSFNV